MESVTLEKDSEVKNTNRSVVLENNEQSEILNYELRTNVGYLFVKRVFDFVASLALSIALLVPMIVISLLIMVRDFGNPLFIHKRVGQNGREINMVKFRSMKKGADDIENMLSDEKLEEYKREYKLKDDPRLIGYKKEGDGNRCFGAILRKTSIDELPQILWNICIKGDMSVVGPRPLLREELEKNYTEEQQRLLISAKPGLTGYWQAYARNDASYESGKRQEMELYYIKNRSLWFDTKILFQTVVSVILKTGAN